MIASLYKYFAIIICGFYAYAKLLNLDINLKRIIINLAMSLVLSACTYYLRYHSDILYFPVMSLIYILFLTRSTKTKLELSIKATMLSFGISYTFYYFLTFIFSVIAVLMSIDRSDSNVRVLAMCVSTTQILLINVLFRFKRLKSGMPFLRLKSDSNIGVFISMLLLCGVMIFTRHSNDELVYIIPLVSIILCGVSIFFWWRDKLTKTYIDRLRADELRNLEEIIQDKDAKIENLKRENDVLARIIHRDNKLIPAMELAVKEYLAFYEEDGTKAREKGRELITQIEKTYGERSGIIKEYQADNGKLPLTNVLSIDSLMKYMYNKARENDVLLELILSGSLTYMIENIISDSDLKTLLADLIENAIIATKKAENKRVLVSIGISSGYYLISVLDSGIPFEADTIVNLGLKKATTHADEGGSGIGLLTIFQILKAHRASLAIEELSDNSIYTKRLSVKFDGLDQYIVKTARYNEIEAISQRKELVILKG